MADVLHLDHAIEALERWHREHRKFSISSLGSTDCCDGLCVTLEAGGRRVELDCNERAGGGEDSEYVNRSIGGMILEALRLWEEGGA